MAVVITATQATGMVLDFEADAAWAALGVRLLMTHENAPRLHKVLALAGSEIGKLLPL